MSHPTTNRPPRLAVLLLSAVALAHEVLLLRLFSIIQWHHFAAMVISLALLGYGASGSLLSLTRSWCLPRFRALFLLNALVFGLGLFYSFQLAQRLPFNTLEILWDPGQWLYLLALYVLLAIPFFCVANALCLAFMAFPQGLAGLYGFDLVGAGLGALGILGLLHLLAAEVALQVLALLALGGGLLAVIELRPRRRWLWLSTLGLAALALLLVPPSWRSLRQSEFKSLQQTLLLPGARVIEERSSPLGVLTLVESPQVPFRLAPGLSLHSQVEPPAQLGVFTDGDGPTPINHFTGELSTLAYLDQLSSAAPYHLAQPRRVLVLGAGGGSELLQAVYHGAAIVDGVELNPQFLALLTRDWVDFSGWDRLPAGVRLHQAEARGYLATSTETYDLIQIAFMDTSASATAGVRAMNETPLYTQEALLEYLAHLAPEALLAISRRVDLPPREGLKLLATAIAALRQLGVRDPGQHLVLVRSWLSLTLVVKTSPFGEEAIQRLLAFCNERGFDADYFPGLGHAPNRVFNRLAEPSYSRAALALLGPEAESFVSDYKFDLRPATDDRPFFYDFFRWRALPEILGLRTRGGMSLLELGYPLMILTLLQALAAGLLLVLLPLRRLGHDSAVDPGYRRRVGGYFLAIGLAYLGLELLFIQRSLLVLHHPVYAAALVLCGFLLFSGLGSLCAPRLRRRLGESALGLVVGGILLSALVAVWLWPRPGTWPGMSETWPQALLILILIAPLAFCMGLPFPLGLERVGRAAPGLVPWAWGINGCASLVSAILAGLLAVHWGFSGVLIAALGLYASVAMIRL